MPSSPQSSLQQGPSRQSPQRPPHHRPDGRFLAPGAPPIANLRDVLRWKFRAPPEDTPPRARCPRWIDAARRALPVPPKCPAAAAPAPAAPGLVATWVNHSTFLLQTAAATILTDPVFSKRCGPFGRLGPARVHAPGVALDALPRIDIVLLSHDHYDHCDLQSLRRIARRDSPLGITPLGNGALLRRGGFSAGRIIELDWWQARELGGMGGDPPARLETIAQIAQSTPAPPALPGWLRVTLTPAQHWSKRLSSRANSRLWGGFYLEARAAPAAAAARRVYFAGDTGYNPAIFQDIAARLGAPDLAFIPIGAYEPRWFMRAQHCNPAEAVQIHRDLGSRQSVAMHWGTFQLAGESRDEPPRALAAALREAGVPPDDFKVLEPGQSIIA